MFLFVSSERVRDYATMLYRVRFLHPHSFVQGTFTLNPETSVVCSDTGWKASYPPALSGIIIRLRNTNEARR